MIIVGFGIGVFFMLGVVWCWSGSKSGQPSPLLDLASFAEPDATPAEETFLSFFL